MRDHWPGFTLVLDSSHVTEYRWDAANARCGETAPERVPWIHQVLGWLLNDQLEALLHNLEGQARDLPAPRQAVLTPVSA